MAGEEIIVLGIDPGSRCTGYGFVREASGQAELIDVGVIRPKGDEFSERLADLFRRMAVLIEKHRPDAASVENVFTAKNAMSALKLGQARGVLVAACAAHNLPVHDYEPTLVKKTLVGTGRAEKTQVAYMVAQILGQRKPEWPLDASDALALAICHLNMRRMNLIVR